MDSRGLAHRAGRVCETLLIVDHQNGRALAESHLERAVGCSLESVCHAGAIDTMLLSKKLRLADPRPSTLRFGQILLLRTMDAENERQCGWSKGFFCAR